jgi:ABC-type phosphate/phosphonate transport system substrate-binding protein
LIIEEPSRDTNVTTVCLPTPTSTVATSSKTADDVTEEIREAFVRTAKKLFKKTSLYITENFISDSVSSLA